MPAYFVGILSEFSHTKNPHYISRNRITDIDTGEVTIKDIEFNFIELEKFNKKVEDLSTLSDKWIYFIKNAENLEVIPQNTNDKGLLYAYQEAQKHLWTQEELDAYNYTDMREEDARAELDAKLKKVENNIKKQVAKSMKAILEYHVIQQCQKKTAQRNEHKSAVLST